MYEVSPFSLLVHDACILVHDGWTSTVWSVSAEAKLFLLYKSILYLLRVPMWILYTFTSHVYLTPCVYICVLLTVFYVCIDSRGLQAQLACLVERELDFPFSSISDSSSIRLEWRAQHMCLVIFSISLIDARSSNRALGSRMSCTVVCSSFIAS